MARAVVKRNAIGVGLGAAALAAAAVVAGCGSSGGGGGSSSTPSHSASSGTAGGTQVQAKLTDFHVALSQMSFKPGTYTFVASNQGQRVHSLEIEGQGAEQRLKATLQPGQSGTVKITLKSGHYVVYCPVDGHKKLGMKMDITVGGGGGTSPSGTGSSKSNGY
jgi:uncharacterized cupredoxin-like copper-binding protein